VTWIGCGSQSLSVLSLKNISKRFFARERVINAERIV